MSIANEIINNNPDKYETVLQSRILGKQLQMKLNQYNAYQRQYHDLLYEQNNNRDKGTGLSDDWFVVNGSWKQLGGSWTDLQNKNYLFGMVSSPTGNTDDWKFLGKTDTLDECKLKSTQNKDNVFSSVVYYPSDFGNDWNKSCFGGVKGKNTNARDVTNTITSLAPYGSTSLGGDSGEIILRKMKTLQDEIKKLSKKVSKDKTRIKQTDELLKNEDISEVIDIENILKRMKNDRIEINKLVKEPDNTAAEEDSYIRQISSYTTYGFWLLQVVILLGMIFYIYSRHTNDISLYVYLFIAIWIFILGKKMYGPTKTFITDTWKDITYYLVIPGIGM